MTKTKEDRVKYPKSIWFIITTEFCERFNYYGMRTILVLYLTKKLHYDDDTATILYHIFSSLAYFAPIMGAIIADSYIGRYKTIIYLSIIYTIGSVIISFGAIPQLQSIAKIITIIGLLLISIGTGGIKPCVSAFGGDQFKIPEQIQKLATFFSLFYFAINAGSLISTAITPIIREDIHCFGETSCYSMAFGVPALLMLISIIVFISGTKLYTIQKPIGNMMLQVVRCIREAIRANDGVTETAGVKMHWLDYAKETCGEQLVEDTKVLMKILVLYLPLPIFWALYDQQGSRWTFQAAQMYNKIGNGFVIKPDQMQIANPLIMLLFIPIFDSWLYPLMKKCGIKTPLQKIACGGLLAAGSFIISGLIDLRLENGFVQESRLNETKLHIFNGFPCTYLIQNEKENLTIQSLDAIELDFEWWKNNSSFEFEASFTPLTETNNNNLGCPNFVETLTISPDHSNNYFLYNYNNNTFIQKFVEDQDVTENAETKIRFLINVNENVTELKFQNENDMNNSVNVWKGINDAFSIKDGSYNLKYNETIFGNIQVKDDDKYVYIIINYVSNAFHYNQYIPQTEMKSIHILWQLPQYVLLTAGEVMFSVTGLEFSFTEAPQSMKSVLQACWLLTVAIGNLLVVFIAKFIKFNSQAYEFFAFAILMILDMGIFILLAIRYKYSGYKPINDSNLNENYQLNNNNSKEIWDTCSAEDISSKNLLEKNESNI